MRTRASKREPGVLPPEPAVAEAAATRVLVVDDDERNLLAIREVLDGTAECVCVQSGEEALRSLLKEEFAVILLDVLMPGLDGYETASLIRQREQSKRTPIIFLTAINKEDAHMLRGYDAGAVDYVFKPFDPVMLRSKVTVFVELFEKTREIQRKAAQEQRLLQQALQANAERLQAEQALRKAQEREEAILRSLPVCFHARASTPPFGAHFVSEAAERVTGFPPERFTSDANFGLSRVHPDDLSGGGRRRSAAPARRAAIPANSAGSAPTTNTAFSSTRASSRTMPMGARRKSSARFSTSPSGGSWKTG